VKNKGLQNLSLKQLTKSIQLKICRGSLPSSRKEKTCTSRITKNLPMSLINFVRMMSTVALWALGLSINQWFKS